MSDSFSCPPSQPVYDWYLYLAPSIGIYFCCLALELIILLVLKLFEKPVTDENEKRDRSLSQCFNSSYKEQFDDFVTGRSLAGRCLLICMFVLSMTSFVLYLIDASRTTLGVPIEYCIVWTQTPLLQADFALNMVFLVYFILRYFASIGNRLEFWLSWKTIIDVATIPTSFTYIAYGRYWSALRFFRVLYIMVLPEVAVQYRIVVRESSIRLAEFAMQFLSFWFVSAGFVHLLENSGDPWLQYYNGQALSYWQCVYFMIVTGSTIGYGDISCKTVLGQIFICFYIFIGLAMFANALPEVINILHLASPYKGSFKAPGGKRHVIVCGLITLETSSKFVANFLHPDLDVKDLVVVFLNPQMPTANFEAFLKQQSNVSYICGSEVHAADLKRVRLTEADACIILANQFADDPDEEDSANIMRAVAIKDLSSKTRIIIQLLLEQNKMHLGNVPNWSSLDAAVCLDEFKMGILATNCWAPGFSTLLSILMTQFGGKSDINQRKHRLKTHNVVPKFGSIPSPSQGSEEAAKDQIEYAYKRGVGMEMYDGELSPDFAGMTFADSVDLCYTRLRILMFAVESNGKIVLCPAWNYEIKSGDRGFFIADSLINVLRAYQFCKKCHRNVQEPEDITCCTCRAGKQVLRNRSLLSLKEDTIDGSLEAFFKQPTKKAQVDIEAGLTTERLAETSEANANPLVVSVRPKKVPMLIPKKSSGQTVVEEKFDYTGMFYWCEPRKFEDALLEIQEARRMNFKDHVVLCVFGDSDSPRIGLRNFVMPLRSSNRHPQELLPIVIIGNQDYILNEWRNISALPAIYVVAESPINRIALRACNIDKCRMSAIVSAKKHEADPILMDKQAILCYLNMKSMKFETEEQALENKTTPDEANIISTSPPSLTQKSNEAETVEASKSNSIPIIADVFLQENVLILDDDITHTTDTPLQLTNPFACGNVFAGNVLDDVTSTAYHSPYTLRLVREIITGGSTNVTERIFAEGLGLIEGFDMDKIKSSRARARISEFHLSDPKYQQFFTGPPCTFSTLFPGVLKQFGYVSLALCRSRDLDKAKQAARNSDRRIVIVYPPPEFHVQPSDTVLCFKPCTVTS